jgi:hypothetical protein
MPPDLTRRPVLFGAAWLLLGFAVGVALAAGGGRRGQGGGGGGGQGGGPDLVFHTTVPAHALDVVLGRAGADRLTLSALAYQDWRGTLAWGAAGGAPAHSRPLTLSAGAPQAVVLDGLALDTAYVCELRDVAGAAAWRGAFHTQRPRGSTYVFTITADSHLDQQTDPALYEQTLRQTVADRPDLHLDLGDTFMTEKYPGDFHAARAQYLAQRYYFGLLSASAPVYLTLGNHDGELGWLLDRDPDNIVTWSCNLRKALFPNPEPGGIYGGNNLPAAGCGLPQNYFAWEWGDALFVVLDPFWPTRERPRPDDGRWARTLGEPQYRWLSRVLAGSRASYKFVFIHHLVGGADKDSRGGIEAAPYCEWGGRNSDGSDGFAAHRTGWGLPIHELLRQYGVTAVFHGHDHFYAHQELDGIDYQEVPQPGHRGAGNTRPAESYGYAAGKILPGAGHLRVTVGPAGAKVEFVQAVAPDEQGPGWEDGRIADSYVLRAAAGR